MESAKRYQRLANCAKESDEFRLFESSRSTANDGVLFLLSTSTSTFDLRNLKKLNNKLKEEYMKCLAEHDAGADACSAVAKSYLECRMDR